MASELLSSLSPDEVAPRLRNECVEPDFGPPSAPRPMIQLGNQEASSPSHYSDDTSLPVGTLLYLAWIAVVAAAITGSFFGSGFFLLPLTAIRQGAAGVGCSPAIMPSLSKRWMVDGATPSTTAAFLIVSSSPSGAQAVGSKQGIPQWRRRLPTGRR